MSQKVQFKLIKRDPIQRSNPDMNLESLKNPQNSWQVSIKRSSPIMGNAFEKHKTQDVNEANSDAAKHCFNILQKPDDATEPAFENIPSTKQPDGCILATSRPGYGLIFNPLPISIDATEVKPQTSTFFQILYFSKISNFQISLQALQEKLKSVLGIVRCILKKY